MVTRIKTLFRLNEEREYEDKLAEDLCFFFIESLSSISDISSEEKEIIKSHLLTIASESRKHSYMFNQLMQMVLEDEKDKY